MGYANKLFKTKKSRIYNTFDDELFIKAMKENCLFHYKRNDRYKSILDSANFDPNKISSFSDLENLPFIPTLYLKHHDLFTVPEKKCLIKGTSSGTSTGIVSHVGLTWGDCFKRGIHMVFSEFKYHKLFSSKPTRYILFAYQPHKGNKTGVTKSTYGGTFFAPSLSKDFAIRWTKSGYKVDLDNLEKKLIKYSKGKAPVRTFGFPAYTYFLMEQMKAHGVKIKLPKGSYITIGGGWKSFYKEKVDKQEFYDLAKEVLGINEDHIVEFFSVVEHPILYVTCKEHHFHVPSFARIIIRDVETFKPVKPGEPGLVNLLSPFTKSMPLLSIMTDDIGILHEGPCPCGEPGPWIEILGRSGIEDIKTCAAGAEELLRGNK